MPGRPKIRARREARAAEEVANPKPKRKSGAPKGNQNARKHGFYAKFLDEKTGAEFERRYALLLEDPRAALLMDAALIQSHVAMALERARASAGDMAIERETVTGVLPAGAIDTRREKSEPIVIPASRALAQAAIIAEKAMNMDPQASALSLARLRELNAKAALAEKEAAADGTSKEPIEIIVREYKEPPEEGGGESS